MFAHSPQCDQNLQLFLCWLHFSGAFYSEKLPGPGTRGRMVVLNTNLYYDQNNETAAEEDPAGQFQWLEETLTNASRADEMVLKRLNKQPGLSPGQKLFLLCSLWVQSQLAGAPCGLCAQGSSCFCRSTLWGMSLLASLRRNGASPGSGGTSTSATWELCRSTTG